MGMNDVVINHEFFIEDFDKDLIAQSVAVIEESVRSKGVDNLLISNNHNNNSESTRF